MIHLRNGGSEMVSYILFACLYVKVRWQVTPFCIGGRVFEQCVV
jgi:hypothetical protein